MDIIARNELGARIMALKSSSRNVETEIHACAVAVLAHTRDHGDWTSGVDLMNALPRGQRVQALAFWFRHFSNGKLSYSQDPKTKEWKGKLDKERVPGDFKVEEAIGTTFADLTTEQAPRTVDLKMLLKSIASKAVNTELNKDGSPKVDPAAREVASKILAFVRENKLDVVTVPKAA